MGVTRADMAAADLHARIAQHAQAGPLAGVEATVATASGRQLLVTLTKLPAGAVRWTEQGLAPTAAGALITDLLHLLAKRACDQVGLTHPSQFRIRPDALAASAGPYSSQRRVS